MIVGMCARACPVANAFLAPCWPGVGRCDIEIYKRVPNAEIRTAVWVAGKRPRTEASLDNDDEDHNRHSDGNAEGATAEFVAVGLVVRVGIAQVVDRLARLVGGGVDVDLHPVQRLTLLVDNR